MSRMRTENLFGARALVLHRPHPGVQPLLRQLAVIGLQASQIWPQLPAEAMAVDFVFYDADMAHEAQFPWAAGAAPMPMIALIGSEAPGRLDWALTMGAHAQLLKPLGDKGVYAALLLARHAYDREREAEARIHDLQSRLSARQTVVQAAMLLALRGKTHAEAYEALRHTAMAWRVSIEEAAGRLVQAHCNEGSPDERGRAETA